MNTTTKHDLEIGVVALGAQYDPTRQVWVYQVSDDRWMDASTDQIREIGRRIREAAR